MPSNILARASYHAVYDDSVLGALAFARQNSFSGIQVAVETPHLAFENISVQECERIAAYCRQHGLRISLHAPDTAVSLFETSRYLQEGTFAYFAALFEFAERIGCRLVTIHPGKISTFGTDSQPRQILPESDALLYRQALQQNLRRLADLVAGRFVVCVENYLMDQMVREVLQPHLDAGELFLCWDLPKTCKNGQYDEAEEGFFWRNIGRIRQVHLHDTDGKRSHLAVGAGQLDFLRYLPRLAAANVLDFCHEVRPGDRAVQSLANLKALIEMPDPRSSD